jgi:CHAD domain-containing protein
VRQKWISEILGRKLKIGIDICLVAEHDVINSGKRSCKSRDARVILTVVLVLRVEFVADKRYNFVTIVVSHREMSYQLRQRENFGENLRRICCKQLDAAIAIAKGEVQTDHDTPVHEMRKHLKKTRAALRLVRKEIGRGLYRDQDCALRDVGRLTSEIRDAEVRLQTVRQLEGITRHDGRNGYGKLEEMLGLELENFVAAFAEWQTQAVPLLEQTRAAIDHWALDQFSSKELCREVRESYKQARDTLDRAAANSTAEQFHAFRTKAKRLGYQLRILRPVNPVVLKALSDDLRSLGDLLGRAHDLNFLGARLRSENGKSTWQRQGQRLLGVIELGQTDLQRNAEELAEHFFAERPRDFGARVGSWLKEWESKSSHSLAQALVT